MKGKTIAQLQHLFKRGKLTDRDIESLQTDKRQGVHKLITAFHKQKLERKRLEDQFTQMMVYEQNLYAQGYKYIAGVDEAGRGPLAGPVVAAAVILPRHFKCLGLNDSKQLSADKLEAFYKIIIKEAISYSVSIVDHEDIDRLNIFQATKRAMRQAIDQLSPQPSHLLIDAVELKELRVSADVITKGDQKSISIAAASIIAKVTRDKLMQDLHKQYPVYQFNTNMGYGTKQHLHMIEKHGISPIHRRSYAPIQRVMNN